MQYQITWNELIRCNSCFIACSALILPFKTVLNVNWKPLSWKNPSETKYKKTLLYSDRNLNGL